MNAFNKTTDVNKLYKIVVNEGLNDDVREATLMKLPQNLLSEVLRNNNCEEKIKLKAIKRVDNQDVMCEVAMKRYSDLTVYAIVYVGVEDSLYKSKKI